MGLSREVVLSDETPVDWPAVRLKLESVSESPVLRMIDGELAFPDEEPAAWQELRVAFAHGMVTLKRSKLGISLVVWGNSDSAMIRAWDLTAWAIASSTGGMIELDGETLPASTFAARRGLFV